MTGRTQQAVRRLSGSDHAGLLLMCEHASARLPAPWVWPEQDRWLTGTHWTYDLGASELCEELSIACGATAVLAQFTRLLVDPNRPEDAATLVLRVAEGRVIELNRAIPEAERQRRIADYWRHYHQAVDRAVAASGVPVLLAVHSFTPDYEGEHRPFEVGVLFDSEQAAAERLARDLERMGADVRLNQPYSGKSGYIYSVDRHARRHGRRALEIEVRQDRAVDPLFRSELVTLLAARKWD